MKYPLLSYSTIKNYLPLIRSMDVSERARSRGQFLDVYKKHKAQLPPEWSLKRENFIKRQYEQYKVKPTIRRRLSLIAWAFDPKV